MKNISLMGNPWDHLSMYLRYSKLGLGDQYDTRNKLGYNLWWSMYRDARQ